MQKQGGRKNSGRSITQWVVGFIALAVGLTVVVGTGFAQSKNRLPEFKVIGQDWTYVAREKGWLDKPFEKDGTKVKIVETPTGTEGALMARGDLHIAERMIYAAMQFKVAGFDITVVDTSKHPDPNVVSIMVPSDSPVKKFEDLKGKKIASTRGGCPYLVLLEMAEGRGWDVDKDIQYLNMPSSEYKALIIAKQVDAISMHPTAEIAPLLQNGFAREIAYPAKNSLYIQGGGVYVNFTPSELAKDHPDVVKKYLTIRYKTLQWIEKNQDEAAAIVQKVRRTPPEVSKFAWSRRFATWKPERNYEKVVTETARLQDWLIKIGDYKPEKKIDLRKYIDPQYYR